ncbi:MAG: hypothetical protein U0269_36670 [Polyangiales bacterium]
MPFSWAMPIHDDDRAAETLLSVLDLATLPLDGLGKVEVERAKRQFAMIEQRYNENNLAALTTALDALGVSFDRASTDAILAMADRYDRAASVDGRIDLQAALALNRAGLRLWNEKRLDEAFSHYDRATQRLAELNGERAVTEWCNATSACAILARERSMDNAVERLQQIMARTFANDDRTIRYWALYTSRRIAAGLVSSGANERALSISRAALALPFEHMKPASNWYEHALFLLGYTMNALRNLERYEESLALCEQSMELIYKATTDAALHEASWVLTEAAFVAAEKLSAPERALPYIAAMRARTSHPKASIMFDEFAYAFSMESRALLLLGRSDEALASSEEALSYARKCNPESAGHAAYASTLVVRGEAFEAQGQREKANECWRECITRFADTTSDDVRSSVSAARALVAK